jgi:glycosyltransferase involved in cell wall biosynthesis
MARFCNQAWSGERVEIKFSRDDDAGGVLGGFYAPEPWGTWSRIRDPWIILPFALEGIVRFSISAAGYSANADRTIGIEIGGYQRELTLRANFEPQAMDFFLKEPCNLIQFSNLDTNITPGAPDPRTMGLGLRWIALERLDGRSDTSSYRQPIAEVKLAGIVYTSVLNPGDGRKNWGDIVKAFCWAFRDTPDATLVLKMTHHSIASFLGRLQFLLHRIGPVRCRVVALHGYLEESEFDRLMDATTYYVNASHGEGLCLPLMEYMSAGIPAIAPDNTAMADYVTPATTFVVRSTPEPTVWPHDPRAMFRTRYYRIDWESLADAFTRSYGVATCNRRRYRAMSVAAREAQARFASRELVGQKLAAFLMDRSSK